MSNNLLKKGRLVIKLAHNTTVIFTEKDYFRQKKPVCLNKII